MRTGDPPLQWPSEAIRIDHRFFMYSYRGRRGPEICVWSCRDDTWSRRRCGSRALRALKHSDRYRACHNRINFQRSASLRDTAVPWFQGRVCLFLVEYQWPTKKCKIGFLMELRQLFRECPASRIAISTRSTTIAQCAGAVLEFGARHRLGSVSEKIFLAHATRGVSGEIFANRGPNLRNDVQKILYVCARLPSLYLSRDLPLDF